VLTGAAPRARPTGDRRDAPSYLLKPIIAFSTEVGGSLKPVPDSFGSELGTTGDPELGEHV